MSEENHTATAKKKTTKGASKTPRTTQKPVVTNVASIYNPKDKRQKIQVSLVEVTPELAQKILIKNHGRNRTIKKRVVANYADLMKNGLWKEINGEPIKISNKGELIDGQHRLHAVLKSNKTIVMMFIENVPEDSMSAIDDGAKRTLADALEIGNVEGKKYNQKTVASYIVSLDVMRQAMLKGCNLNQARSSRNSSITATVNFGEKVPNLYETLDIYLDTFNAKEINRVIPNGTAAIPMYYIFSQIDKDFTETFFKTMETGIPCDGLDSKSPSFMVYKAIINAKLKKTVLLRLTDYFEMFIWAMEKTVNKIEPKILSRKRNFLITNDYMHSDRVVEILKKLG